MLVCFDIWYTCQPIFFHRERVLGINKSFTGAAPWKCKHLLAVFNFYSHLCEKSDLQKWRFMVDRRKVRSTRFQFYFLSSTLLILPLRDEDPSARMKGIFFSFLHNKAFLDWVEVTHYLNECCINVFSNYNYSRTSGIVDCRINDYFQDIQSSKSVEATKEDMSCFFSSNVMI